MPRTVWVTVAVGVLLLGTPGSAVAVNKSWMGGDGLWNDGTKWMPSGAPMPGDVVFTSNDAGADITLSGTGASVGRVYGIAHLVVDGTTLTITGDPNLPPQPSNLSMSEIVGGGALAVTALRG